MIARLLITLPLGSPRALLLPLVLFAGAGLANPSVLGAVCGDSVLDVSETCDDGNTVAGDGCSDACLIESGWTCTAPVPEDPGSNVVADPSFEAGKPNPFWTEFSLNFGSPIFDISASFVTPPVGAWSVWFGYEVDEVASVEQSVTIPASATTLTFDLFVELCDSASDFVKVWIDKDVPGATPVFERFCTPGSEDVDFVGQSGNISAYADDGTHLLRLESESFGVNGVVSSFFVDNVAIGDNVKQPSRCFRLIELTCNGPAIDFDLPIPGIPADWAVVDNVGASVAWADIVTARESANYTSGSGQAATASSDRFGPAAFDTELRTAPFALPALDPGATVSLDYLANYRDFGAGDFLDVDISTDGGAGWANLLSWNVDDHGDFRSKPGEPVSIDLSAYAGMTGLIVRWRYRDATASALDWYAQLDDVRLSCSPIVEVTPASLTTTQQTNTQAEQTLTIGNQGVVDLQWTIDEAPTTCASATGVSWLAASPAAGTTSAGADALVTVTFDATGRPEGTDAAYLCVRSNDPVNPIVEVPVTMEVTGCVDQLVLANETLTGGTFQAGVSITGGPGLVIDGPVSFVAGQDISFLDDVEIGSGFSATVGDSPCP